MHVRDRLRTAFLRNRAQQVCWRCALLPRQPLRALQVAATPQSNHLEDAFAETELLLYSVQYGRSTSLGRSKGSSRTKDDNRFKKRHVPSKTEVTARQEKEKEPLVNVQKSKPSERHSNPLKTVESRTPGGRRRRKSSRSQDVALPLDNGRHKLAGMPVRAEQQHSVEVKKAERVWRKPSTRERRKRLLVQRVRTSPIRKNLLPMSTEELLNSDSKHYRGHLCNSNHKEQVLTQDKSTNLPLFVGSENYRVYVDQNVNKESFFLRFIPAPGAAPTIESVDFKDVSMQRSTLPEVTEELFRRWSDVKWPQERPSPTDNLRGLSSPIRASHSRPASISRNYPREYSTGQQRASFHTSTVGTCNAICLADSDQVQSVLSHH